VGEEVDTLIITGITRTVVGCSALGADDHVVGVGKHLRADLTFHAFEFHSPHLPFYCNKDSISHFSKKIKYLYFVEFYKKYIDLLNNL